MFYDNFLAACTAKQTTPAQVRKALGISQSTMASWKSRSLTPKYGTVKKIADYLHVDWTELVPEEEQASTVISHITEGLSDGRPFRKMSDSEAHKAGLLQFNSDSDRIAYFYGKLNTDGKLTAAKCFYKNLDASKLAEVADYVEQLAEIPQYQRTEQPEDPPEDK